MSRQGNGVGLGVVVFVAALVSVVVSVSTVIISKYVPLPGPAGSAVDPVSSTQIPNLVGMSEKVAKQVLDAKGLEASVKEKRASDKAVGIVVEQTPPAGTRLQAGDKVFVVLSSGATKAKVPLIMGKPLADARKLVTDAGLEVGEVKGGADGKVIGVKPGVGTELKRGEKIVLTVQSPTKKVPKLVGMRIREARKTIEEAGFKVGKVRERYSEYRGAYVILSQEPEPDSDAEPGTEINLVMNEGD